MRVRSNADSLSIVDICAGEDERGHVDDATQWASRDCVDSEEE